METAQADTFPHPPLSAPTDVHSRRLLSDPPDHQPTLALPQHQSSPTVPVMAPSSRTRSISQTLLDEMHPLIRVLDDVQVGTLDKAFFDTFFEGSPIPRLVGLAPMHTPRGILSHLVIAIKAKAAVIQFPAKNKKPSAGRDVLASEILCNPDVTVVAFDFSKLAIQLFSDQDLRVLNAVDIQRALMLQDRTPLAAIKFAASDKVKIIEDNVKRIFANQNHTLSTSYVLRAWIAQCLPTFEGMEEKFERTKRINTKDLSNGRLDVYTQMERGEQHLQFAEPNFTTHEFSGAQTKGNKLSVTSERYQTRIQSSKRAPREQRIEVFDEETELTFFARGEVSHVHGRKTDINLSDTILNGRVTKNIITEGPDGPTNADRQREELVLTALQDPQKDLFDNPFLKYLLDYTSDFAWPDSLPVDDTIHPIVTQRPLNESQERAVKHMLLNTNDNRVTIIQGPPGTGKTTVIAAFVCSAIAAGSAGIWLTAQSNIAVKNIAEKLHDVGFNDWRLLVSDDFHDGWHEHLYGNLKRNIIRSSEFKQARSRVRGIPVILCTLSMLAHPLLTRITSANPVKTIVVDEASQIPVANYVVPLTRYSDTVQKMCMIGDDKQLPPFGTDDERSIPSVFEVEHVRPSVIFLTIQYRMPSMIGDVVSDVVYEGQLQSNPDHPVKPDEQCCWFVHTHNAQEMNHDKSIHNPAERDVVLKLAAKLASEDKKYCIITPYDAQRSLLEQQMKDTGMNWHDMCFNVDSFQGNERDYVIVSLVRSRALGFLADIRRTNVMLTRCKRGMFIVTSYGFVNEVAKGTLVGRMASQWGNQVWINSEHIGQEAIEMV